MTVRAHTNWGCPCSVRLDPKGSFESAVDYFGTPLRRDQVQVPQTLTDLWARENLAPTSQPAYAGTAAAAAASPEWAGT